MILVFNLTSVKVSRHAIYGSGLVWETVFLCLSPGFQTLTTGWVQDALHTFSVWLVVCSFPISKWQIQTVGLEASAVGWGHLKIIRYTDTFKTFRGSDKWIENPS